MAGVVPVISDVKNSDNVEANIIGQYLSLLLRIEWIFFTIKSIITNKYIKINIFLIGLGTRKSSLKDLRSIYTHRPRIAATRHGISQKSSETQSKVGFFCDTVLTAPWG